MADEPQITSRLGERTIQVSSAQFEYPQLLIEASFESLLTHSHRSFPAAETPMPSSETSLSESWGSLSEHELHDDDLGSEITDSVSLIDVSTTGDVYTVNEDGNVSDVENEDMLVDEDLDDLEHNGHTSRLTEHVSSGSNDATSLPASQSYTKVSLYPSIAECGSRMLPTEASEQMQIPMASQSLSIGHKPYQILYYGSPFSSTGIKADVLGKIGAALITSNDHYNHEEESAAPCYHVVPSEFGPGSRPSTADLIPIPTQMHVIDCDVSDLPIEDTSGTKIQLQLSNEWVVTSRPASCPHEVQSVLPWEQPDLVVIVVSRHDLYEDTVSARKIAEFANRHAYPLLCLRQESGYTDDDALANSNTLMLHKLVQQLQCDDVQVHQTRALLDVDSFLLLDTEQISRHLNFVTLLTRGLAQVDSSTNQRIPSPFQSAYDQCTSLLHTVLSGVGLVDGSIVSRPSRWVIQTTARGERTSQQQPRGNKPMTFGSGAKRPTRFVDTIAKNGVVIGMAIFTLLLTYFGQILLYQLLAAKPLQTYVADNNNVSHANHMHTTVSTSRDIATVTNTPQVFALSGPFHALEKQVQSWLPLNIANGKADTNIKHRKDAPNEIIQPIDEFCQNIVPVHIAPSLKVDPKFFPGGELAFKIHVLRGVDVVAAKVEKQSDGSAIVLVKRKDSHGILKVHLNGHDEHVCATLDLENSLAEALTSWIKSLRHQGHKLKTAKTFVNQYVRLLEVRTTQHGLINNVLEARNNAARGFGAVVEAVEKSAIKHAKTCQTDEDKCFLHKLVFPKAVSDSLMQARQSSEDFIQGRQKQISETVKQARQSSEDFIQGRQKQISETVKQARQASGDFVIDAQRHIVRTTQQAKDQVNSVRGQAREEVSKTMDMVRLSLNELAELGKIWPRKASKMLSRAQNHAQGLAKKAELSKSKGRKSR